MIAQKWYLDESYWNKSFRVSNEDFAHVIKLLRNEGDLSIGSLVNKLIEHHLKQNLDIPESFGTAKIFSAKGQYSENENIIFIDINGDIQLGTVQSKKHCNDFAVGLGKGETYYIKCDLLDVRFGNAEKNIISNSEDYYKIKQSYMTLENIVAKTRGVVEEKLVEKLSINRHVFKDRNNKWKIAKRIHADEEVKESPQSEKHTLITPVSQAKKDELAEQSIPEIQEDKPPSKQSPYPRVRSKIFPQDDDEYFAESLRDFHEFNRNEWEKIKIGEVSIVLMFANIYNGYIPYTQLTKKLIPPDVKTIILKDKHGNSIRLRKSSEQRMFYNYSKLSRYLQKPDIFAGTKLYLKRLDDQEYLMEFKENPKTVMNCRIVRYDKQKKMLFYEYRDMVVKYECIEPIFRAELRFQDIIALWEEARLQGLSIADITYLEFKKLSEESKGNPINFYDLYYKVYLRRMCSVFAVWSILKRHPTIFKRIRGVFWMFIEEGKVTDNPDKDIDIAMPRRQLLYKIAFIISSFLILSVLIIQLLFKK